MRILIVFLFAMLTIPFTLAQQNQAQNTTPANAIPVTPRKDRGKKEPPPASTVTPDKSAESGKPAEPPKAESGEAADKDKDKEEHYDVAEVPAIVTHHQVAWNGKTLSYTATAGRLPLKRSDGKIEAEMFFVAYTLDGQDT
jgi:carboxypeptidase C (cathepsin A)